VEKQFVVTKSQLVRVIKRIREEDKELNLDTMRKFIDELEMPDSLPTSIERYTRS